MNRILSSLLLLPLALGAADFRLVNIFPYSPGNEAQVAADMKAYAARTGERETLYSLSFHPEGKPARVKADQLLDSYRKLNAALKGSDVRLGVLIQSVLGHWPRHDEHSESWDCTVTVRGKTTPRFCPDSPGFRDYVTYFVTELAKERPAFVLGDDDIHFKDECCCRLHAAKFNALMGTDYGPEELAKAVDASRTGDPVWSAFLRIQRESMTGLCAHIRAAIDAVDPTIPAGMCMSGAEYRFIGDLAAAIAAKGQRPWARIANTGDYREYRDLDFSDYSSRSLMFAAIYGGACDLYDESDVFPHTLWYRSSSCLHAKLTTAQMAGLQGGLVWFAGAHKGGSPVADEYMRVLERNRGFRRAFGAAIEGTRLDGFSVFVPTNFPNWHFTGKDFSSREGFLASAHWGRDFGGVFGVPYRMTTDAFEKDAVYALAGRRTVERLSDGQLKAILSARVLLDGDATLAVADRGFADLLGVRPVHRKFSCTREAMADGSIVPMAFLPDAPRNETPFFESPAAKAEVLSWLEYVPFAGSKEVRRVAPGAVRYVNALGGRVVSTAYPVDLFVEPHVGAYWNHTLHFSHLTESRKRWFERMLSEAYGTDLPVASADDRDIYLLSRTAKDGSRIILLVNQNRDALEGVRLRFARPPARIERLTGEGAWEPVSFVANGGEVKLDLTLACYETLVLRTRPSSAYEFSDNQPLTLAKTPSLAAADGATLEFRMRLEKGDNPLKTFVFAYGKTGAPGSFHLAFNAGGYDRRLLGVFETSDGPNGAETDDFAFDDGKWHDVAFVIDRTAKGDGVTRLYLDGRPFTTSRGWRSGMSHDAPTPFTDATLTVGSDAEGRFKLRGYVSDVRLTPRALAPEAFARYDGEPSVEPLGPSLQADRHPATFNRQRTTRRYLHGPLSERMLVFFVEGKILVGDVMFPSDRLVSVGAWLLHGDRPFDWRHSEAFTPPDGVPVHGQRYRDGDLEVTLEACAPFGRAPNAFARAVVVNRGTKPIDDTLTVEARLGPERKLVSFWPDIYDCHDPKLADYRTGGTNVWTANGRVFRNGEAFVAFGAQPGVRPVLADKAGAIALPIRLQPGESRTIEYAVGQGEAPATVDFGAVADGVRGNWAKELGRLNKVPSVIADDPEKLRLTKNLVVQLLQCFNRVKGEDLVLFRQGGLSRNIWVGEAETAFEPLARLGDFGDYFRPVLDGYFRTFLTPSGEIDTRRVNWVPWARTTACALQSLAQYCVASGDAGTWRRHRDAAMKAFDFVKAKLDAPREAGLVKGIYPPEAACDWGEIFQAWGSTDVAAMIGLEAFATACETFGDARAKEVRTAAADYRAALAKAMEPFRAAAKDADELYVPLSPDGLDRELVEAYYPLLHHGKFAAAGLLSAAELLKVKTYLERRGQALPERGLYSWMPWTNGWNWFITHSWYTTMGEYHWFRALRAAGEDALAQRILDGFIRYAMTDQCYMTERFTDNSEWCVPWSPNASGNGRLLGILLASEGLRLPEILPRTALPPEDEAPAFLPPEKCREGKPRNEAWAEK